jgi:hypothetical protein
MHQLLKQQIGLQSQCRQKSGRRWIDGLQSQCRQKVNLRQAEEGLKRNAIESTEGQQAQDARPQRPKSESESIKQLLVAIPLFHKHRRKCGYFNLLGSWMSLTKSRFAHKGNESDN